MYPSCISKCEQKEKAFNNIKHSDSTLIDVTNYLKKKKKKDITGPAKSQ